MPKIVEQKVSSKSNFKRSLLVHRENIFSAKPTLKFSKNVEFIDFTVPISSMREIPARIIRPKIKPENGLYPTLFYIPGTAFIAYENQFTNLFCSHVADLAQCQVIILYHALAPEFKFPQGYKDALALFEYFVKTNPSSYKIDTKNIAISGYSSGGNFAALLAIQAKEKNLPFNRQILISPLVDLSRTISRLPEFHDLKQYEEQDKAITPEFVAWFLELYIPPNFDPKTPELSPFWQHTKRFEKLPPTDIILAEYDRFRTDAEAYYNKLKQAKVPVEKIIFDKENHTYVWYNILTAQRVADQLKIAFRADYIDKPVANALIYVVPKQPSIDEIKKIIEEKEDQHLESGSQLQLSTCSGTIATSSYPHIGFSKITRRITLLFNHLKATDLVENQDTKYNDLTLTI